jgi:hypothetical protein
MLESCPTCGYVDRGAALRVALADAKKEFPATLDFFDFGDGIITMPMPDPSGNGYLTKSLSILIEADPLNPVPEDRLGKVLAFSYHLRFGSRGEEVYKEVLNAALKAFERFEKEAVRIKAGDRFPSPIEV